MYQDHVVRTHMWLALCFHSLYDMPLHTHWLGKVRLYIPPLSILLPLKRERIEWSDLDNQELPTTQRTGSLEGAPEHPGCNSRPLRFQQCGSHVDRECRDGPHNQRDKDSELWLSLYFVDLTILVVFQNFSFNLSYILQEFSDMSL